MFGPFKKEKPLLGLTGMSGGAATYFVKGGGYTNPGEWTRILNQPGSPATAGSYLEGTIDTSGYRALLIFGISGGGGGGANGNDNGAGGGGGGGYVAGHVADVTDIDEVTYRVPGGGAGGVGDSHGPPTGWPARQNGGDSPPLGLGPPTSFTSLFAIDGATGGKGGYVYGGSGLGGGTGGNDPSGYPTGVQGGSGGRSPSCDNPPDGGNPGSGYAATGGGAGGGGSGGTWCDPSNRGGTDGANSTIGGPNTISTWTLPPSFPVGGGSPYPLDVAFASHGDEGESGGPTNQAGGDTPPAEGGDGQPGGTGGGGAGGGVEFYGTGNTGYGAGGGGAASRGGDASSGGDGGAGYLIVYAQ